MPALPNAAVAIESSVPWTSTEWIRSWVRLAPLSTIHTPVAGPNVASEQPHSQIKSSTGKIKVVASAFEESSPVRPWHVICHLERKT